MQQVVDYDYIVQPNTKEMVLLLMENLEEYQQKKALKIQESNQKARQKYNKNHVRINATFTEKEAEILKKEAKKRGEKPSAFLKKMALKQIKKQKEYLPTEEELELFRKVTLILGGIGNNINQLAHQANIDKTPDKIDAIGLRKQVAEAYNLIENFCHKRPFVKENAE